MGPLTFQDANRRLKEMEHESIALRADFDSKSEEIASLRLQLRQALAEIDDLKLEIENNAGEFSILGSGY
jgi:chromosome segregation ATPase